MYDSWELLSKDPTGGRKRNRECWSQPQDTWTSVAMLCQVWSHLRMLASPAWHKDCQMAKPQAVLMDCTAVSPEDTRGQEALTQKLRLEF